MRLYAEDGRPRPVEGLALLHLPHSSLKAHNCSVVAQCGASRSSAARQSLQSANKATLPLVSNTLQCATMSRLNAGSCDVLLLAGTTKKQAQPRLLDPMHCAHAARKAASRGAAGGGLQQHNVLQCCLVARSLASCAPPRLHCCRSSLLPLQATASNHPTPQRLHACRSQNFALQPPAGCSSTSRCLQAYCR
jgi:hypothetical protein